MPKNWAGTYEYTAPRIVTAATEDDVVRIVAEGGPVHALGTRHSFTDLPETVGTLVDVAALEGGYRLDEEAGTVSVAGGTRYGVLAQWLDARGLALHNLGSLPHISVAGATATATHGSGNGNGVLTSAVRGIRFVGADAALHDVHPSDPDFPALAVGLGAFGIVTEVTLAVEPTFRVRQDIYQGVSWDAALEHFDELTGAGYSVSVFTRWDEGLLGDAWVKTRLASDDDPVSDELLDGARQIEANPLADSPDTTQLGGVPGPWMLRLPHFRLDGAPSFGDELQTEYFIARSDAPAALRAIRALREWVQPHLLVSELRTAASDDLWLSGAYQRDFLAIHFTWRNHPEGVLGVLPSIEAALAPFHARPHWGKVHRFDAEKIARVHPRIADARAVFERRDPEGRFANAHLQRLGVREVR